MSNVFKKLISKELGEVNYHRYFSFIKRNSDRRLCDSRVIFDDMYEKLRYRDFKSIARMHNRLNETMLLAFRISRNFVFAILYYLGAMVYLISMDISPELTAIALVLMNICFLYKVYEFICNKFCYIDAQIILVYKAVLDRIILSGHQRQFK
jgi:hypothetical protein